MTFPTKYDFHGFYLLISTLPLWETLPHALLPSQLRFMWPVFPKIMLPAEDAVSSHLSSSRSNRTIETDKGFYNWETKQCCKDVYLSTLKRFYGLAPLRFRIVELRWTTCLVHMFVCRKQPAFRTLERVFLSFLKNSEWVLWNMY